MARVHFKKARKDYPDSGIKKGDQYYFCQIKTGPRSSRIMRQLTPFKPSQLTSSEFRIAQLSLQERIEELTLESLRDELEGIADEIRSLGEEQQEKLDNMPEGLQQGQTGEMLQNRYDMCEEWASELEDVYNSLPDEPDTAREDIGEEPEEPEEDASDEEREKYEEALQAWQDKVDEWDNYDSEMDDALSNAQNCEYQGE